MSLSDHIVVLNGGRVEQEGTPQEVYAAPVSRFVAEFVGAANVIEGVGGAEGVRVDGALVRTGLAEPPTGEVSLALRPERVRVSGGERPLGAAGHGGAYGEVVHRAFLGDGWETRVRVGESLSLGARTDTEPPAVGARVTAHWDAESVIRLRDTGGA